MIPKHIKVLVFMIIFVLYLISETSGELGWMLTLAIVSILSAAVGAVVMVTVLQCRK